MTTLTEILRQNQSLVAVSDPDDIVLDRVYQIEEEYVIARSRPRPGGKIFIGRGFLGSVRAEHAASTELTLVHVAVQTDTPSAPPPAAVGVGSAQVILLLGPYVVRFDTDDIINDNSVFLDDLPSGCAVIRAWGETVTAWNGAQGGDTLIVGVRGTGNDAQYGTLINVDLNNAPVAQPGTRTEEANSFTVPTSRITRLLGAGTLVVSSVLTAQGTTGQTDIYVLVAVPTA